MKKGFHVGLIKLGHIDSFVVFCKERGFEIPFHLIQTYRDNELENINKYQRILEEKRLSRTCCRPKCNESGWPYCSQYDVRDV